MFKFILNLFFLLFSPLGWFEYSRIFEYSDIAFATNQKIFKNNLPQKNKARKQLLSGLAADFRIRGW